jgi:hypothetical protein
MASSWSRVAGKKVSAIRELNRFIPFYEYSSAESADMTNNKFCKLMTDKLRISKNVLFNIINTSYELHIKNELKDLNKIRDELDIFLDEIKVMNLKWNEDISEKWLEKLVTHDLNLIKGSDSLAKNLEASLKKITRAKTMDTGFWKEMAKADLVIEEQLDGLVRMFKEREALLSLKPLSFEKVYKAARKEISEKI